MDTPRGITKQYSLFNPILPLMKEKSDQDGGGDDNGAENKSIIRLQSSNENNDDCKTLLSSQDISKLLNEHVRTLEAAVSGINGSWPPESSDGVLSSSEATLSLIFGALQDLSTQYDDSLSFIEKMMENQLVAAIGKRLTPNDLDKFVKFHNVRLLRPTPKPFSHAIRRPDHYPVGLLSIESHDGETECIHSHSREVVATANLKIPLSAATVLELTGQQYLHGYMNHRFGNSHKSHQLVARARQFSSFILVIGNMTDGSTLDPKDAIIVQNKDELLIPLILDELPTAKEFKDAVKSLSPEQQRFARAYRKMQLASSVFGVCVVQIKPQLEALLGLPADALDKEMKLTQDLMELFVEYQVPSDLLSYTGFCENAAVEDKISNVRDNVKGVLDVVNAEKEKQLQMERGRADMAMEMVFQDEASKSTDSSLCSVDSLGGEMRSSRFLSRGLGSRKGGRKMAMMDPPYNVRLLRPTPKPFSHAIRRPDHYPVGLLSIESHDGETECIHSHSREVVATANLKIPLSAATVLELTGQQYLHGYMNHRFGNSHKSHQLVARARQFSSFILVIGNMTDGSTLDPKDAIIVQNKDELLIPLMLDELPTAKEFKDAVKSLSPEQQRFAHAYRKMQLASSIFGVCVVQVKPQLEALLGLPADALDKEMKLTQDLMELFVEYQVPSDLLSYTGFCENAAVEDKISNVRDNVKGVLDVVNAEKEKHLQMERAKADMAMEMALQDEASKTIDFSRRSVDSLGGEMRSSRFHSAARKGGRKMAMMDPPSSARCLALSMTETFGMEPMQHSEGISFDADEVEIQHPTQVEEKPTTTPVGPDGQAKMSPDKAVDFTLIPTALDAAVEKSGEGSALRSTTIKTGDVWTRNRQENLLTKPKRQSLDTNEVKKEKNKAFDLLDALSRSGSLPIAYNELHVVVAVTHCFDKDVMSTVVCDNINPIEKLECSTLLLASAVHGVPVRDLIGDASELQRLEGSVPLLLQPSKMSRLQMLSMTQT
eukprot:CAMPEP_0196193486 /NCGR_PEP_ID=MMETSP0911-20130528/49561_1 /TAXON_ID=49265 /ORGANISM="Thalassiosira rotula, Strain GSO102" /LENGTH=999 /DNA_ID=CAMNT_0041465725 /DNA_START=1424 /DNA_END=4423 /DNA_ORIENTATION=-